MLSKYALNNYRMAGYLLIALGLINLRYQSGSDSILARSLYIILPGLVLVVLTFISSLHRILAQRAFMAVSALIGCALVFYAFAQ